MLRDWDWNWDWVGGSCSDSGSERCVPCSSIVCDYSTHLTLTLTHAQDLLASLERFCRFTFCIFLCHGQGIMYWRLLKIRFHSLAFICAFWCSSLWATPVYMPLLSQHFKSINDRVWCVLIAGGPGMGHIDPWRVVLRATCFLINCQEGKVLLFRGSCDKNWIN